MIASDAIAKLGRVQQSTTFKIVASIIIVVLAVGAAVAYAVGRQADRIDRVRVEVVGGEAPASDEAVQPGAAAVPEAAERAGAGGVGDGSAVESAEDIAKRIEAERTAMQRTADALNNIIDRGAATTDVAVQVGILALVALALVWLGLGLTMLGLVVVLGVVVGPLLAVGGNTARGAAAFVSAVALLTAAFFAFMQMLRLALSPSSPAIAVARNVVQEATRMKVSLLFIIMLLAGLAALPGLLDPATPLRYRVQSFLSYATSGSFFLVAVLAIFLAAGSVAFEQRDRIIWQTMTKPVTTTQYVLGKWLGVMGVSLVLLVVSATGVFAFVEYLRNQPALGESAPYVAAGQIPITDDRLILETQVLSARASVGPQVPDITDETLAEEIDARVRAAQAADPTVVETLELREKFRQEYAKEYVNQYLAIEPGMYERFVFPGLERARRSSLPLTLRFRVNSGGNDPTALYRISFYVEGSEPFVRQCPLAQTLTLTISPAAIKDDNTLPIEVYNWDVMTRQGNPQTISFPPDGLQLSYAVGSYSVNFWRAIAVLWLKIGFLAAVGVCAATFVSFPVACLFAFGVFFVSESSGFLWESVDAYASRDETGQVDYFRVLIRAIAVPVALLFKNYSTLQPTTDLVEGRLIPWRMVGLAAAILGAISAVALIAGSVIFRRRELATYSGK